MTAQIGVGTAFVHADYAPLLDERVANPYLAAMTSRLILTMLALLTGLSVQSAHVHARENSAGPAQIGAVVMLEPAGVARSTCGIAVASGRTAPEGVVADVASPSCRSQHFLVPPVLTGIDRARE